MRERRMAPRASTAAAALTFAVLGRVRREGRVGGLLMQVGAGI